MSPISHDGNATNTYCDQSRYMDGYNGSTLHANGAHSNGVVSNGTGLAGHGSEPMAIIGMACRFPQEAENPERFWKLLIEGRSAMTEFPKHKFNVDSHYHPDAAHGSSMSNRGGHFLKNNGAAFDAQFFTLTKTEALSMDPQQRILMENVYLALENAGITMEQATSSKTSVFVSAFTNDYQKSILGKDPDVTLKYMPTGTSNSILANRVSWFYDFKGTSVTLDTACSSSLVAFHLACQDLSDKRAEMAIVSGVNIIEDPELFYRMSALGFLSPDSRCYSFDHRANGYSRGEGVGTIILKPLSRALRDGNMIRAVVRGTGVNSDGRTPGITLPSKVAQESLIRSVYANAGLDLVDTGFVEAHGTGTSAGDPIEAGAIAMSWRDRKSSIPLYIGALKSNVGHLEGASGVAGLIKAVMVLEKGIIPPNINFEKVNPKIPIKDWNIDFPLAPMAWPGSGLRRISVNSFGFGGTNAHAVLDDAYHYLEANELSGSHATVTNTSSLKKEFEPLLNIPKKRVFVWSASDEAGTRRLFETYCQFLNTNKITRPEDHYLDDLAYTLAKKRTLFPYRSYVQAANLSELVGNLSAEGRLLKSLRAKDVTNIGFIFTGQGAQWARMGLELLQYPSFRASFEAADGFIKLLGSPWGLLDEFHREAKDSKINHPTVSQTICTVLQLALVDLFAAWNVRPSRVVGHSSGEIAAAYAAGAITRESAWKIAYYRGVVSATQTAKKGAMMAVGITEEKLLPYMDRVHVDMDGELTIACFNSPRSLTISGDETTIDALKTLLDADEIFARKLKVMNAYHSSHMQAVAGEYLRLIGDISKSTGDLKTQSPEKRPSMYSCVTGKVISPEDLSTGQYWVDNLVSEVRFSQALMEMCAPEPGRGRRRIGKGDDDTIQALLELGPHPALQGACNDTLSSQQLSIPYLHALMRNEDAITSILHAVGRLFCQGYPVDLNAVNHSSYYAEGVISKLPATLVDLPAYTFNHSQTYWPESRLSKNFRFRKYPRHDLLGAPVPDWNAAEPRWRHMIRLSENPWLRDHEITGGVVYPGVGYMIMAIEACRQLEEFNSDIVGFRLRDVSIKTALQVPDVEDGVETMISMRSVTESSLSSSTVWREFWISSYSTGGNSWTEHCRGKISVEYKVDTGPVDDGREAAGQKKIFTDMLAHVTEDCQNSVDMTGLYADLETIGLKFGPLFRNLSEAKYAGDYRGEAIANVTIPDVAASMPKNYLEPHAIHPATMDSMLHMFLAAFQDLTGGAKIIEPLLPIFIQEVWLSAVIDNKPGQSFRAHGSVRRASHKKLHAAITVWDNEGVGIMTVRGMQAIPLQDAATNVTDDRNLCYNIQWKPDIDILDTKQGHAYFRKALTQDPIEDGEVLRWTKELQMATIIYIRDAVRGLNLSNPPPGGFLWYHEKYLKWLRHWISEFEKGAILHQTSEWPKTMDNPILKKEFLDRVCRETLDGKLLARMGPQIVPILLQEADAIELMFGDDILEVYYRETIGTTRIQSQLVAYLQTLSHKRNNLKVLEIGAGTGGTTGSVLYSLSPRENGDSYEKTSMLSSYTYTDISAGFFENARNKFKHWRNVLTFKTLNIENEVTSQGFQEADYDIIVAANVLHATADLNNTLANVRRLLRPGGKLILVEGTQPHLLRGPMCFGLLPGWWLSIEPERQLGPLLSQSGWNDVLKNRGFNGVEFFMQDYEDHGTHFQSLVISSAVSDNPKQDRLNEEVLVVVSTSNGSQDIGASLQISLNNLGVSKTSVVSYSDLEKYDLKKATCIALFELVDPLLLNMDEASMANIRHMITTAAGILWVAKDPVAHPEVALVSGLIRAVRWERDLDESNLIVLSFGNNNPSQKTITEQILKVYEYQFLQNANQRHEEYLFKDGLLSINRLTYCDPVNSFLHRKTAKPAAQQKPFGADPSRALALSIRTPGLLDTLEFVDDPKHFDSLGPEEIEVQIKATGLNFRDVMVAMNEIDDIALGLEAAGIVTRIGSNNSQNLQVGDRVMILSNISGCFQTYARTTQELAIKIPDHMSFEIAAGIPVTFSTAYYCLVDIAHLSKGESILIHAAAGGVGQAAIMLAQHLDAILYVTVSSEEKKNLIMEKYHIPAENIFSSRGLSFAQGIMRATKGRGVDVILNSLSGEALRRSWDCIAPFGRFIEIGKKDVYANGKLDMYAFSKSATFAAVDLNLVIHLDPKTGGRLLRKSLSLWETGIVDVTSPFNIFNYGQIEEAFRLLQAGKHIGKVVLQAYAENLVKVVLPTQTPYRFPSNVSYILPGGLGGIGRSTARWMASRGARSLIFLSRSGASKENTKNVVKELLEDLKQNGCTVTVFRCDISDKETLAKVIEECKTTLPPIKGCIHGGMLLKDSAFENMSLEKFNAALRPKVQGSWNLHSLLPKDLDFFIMLSSISGILGNRGQSNYAAGNTYQDSLAHHRLNNGLPAVSLDLGNILSVGFIAENQDLFQGNMSAITQEGVREDELQSVFEYHVDPRNRSFDPVNAQVAVGLFTAATFKRKGMPEPSFMSHPLFTHLRSENSSSSTVTDEDSSGMSTQALLLSSQNLDDASNVVVESIVRRLSTTLAIPVGDIDPAKPIHFYGVDSLVAMEFRSWFAKSMACDIPVLDIMGNSSISALSRKIASVSKHVTIDGEDTKEKGSNME